MGFDIYLIENIRSQIGIDNPVNVATIDLTKDNFIRVGNNYIPISNVLYIKEV